jgi:hypothetical protein
MSAPSAAPPRTVICVGDVHGYITKLESLWSNLEAALPADAFATALVIFLGDYNDRGPHTRRVLDFLLALPTRHPAQRHVFLCGNHDLAFAAFVGALPPPPDGSPFSATWDEYIHNEEHEGWFRGPGYEGNGHARAGEAVGRGHQGEVEPQEGAPVQGLHLRRAAHLRILRRRPWFPWSVMKFPRQFGFLHPFLISTSCGCVCSSYQPMQFWHGACRTVY